MPTTPPEPAAASASSSSSRCRPVNEVMSRGSVRVAAATPPGRGRRPRATASNCALAGPSRCSASASSRAVSSAGGQVDASFQIADRPRAQARRLRELLLGQPGLPVRSFRSRPAKVTGGSATTPPPGPAPNSSIPPASALTPPPSRQGGQAAQARVLLRQALKILQRIGAAGDVARELTTLTKAGPPHNPGAIGTSAVSLACGRAWPTRATVDWLDAATRLRLAKGAVQVPPRRPEAQVLTEGEHHEHRLSASNHRAGPRRLRRRSGWRPLDDLLTQDGYHVAVVQNPTLTLQGDAAATRLIIDAQDGPVVLVGHSYAAPSSAKPEPPQRGGPGLHLCSRRTRTSRSTRRSADSRPTVRSRRSCRPGTASCS